MSQLIDKLNRTAKGAPQPMGFHATQPVAARPQMLLIASLAEGENVNSLSDQLEGADAVLVHFAEADARAGQRLAKSLSGVLWGGWLGDSGEKETNAIVDAGADFLVFPEASAVSATPQANKVGRVIRVEASVGEGLLRAINELPVDAVLVGCEDKGEPLSWHELMVLQRSASLLVKPLLAAVPAKLTAGELETLWKIGVDGLVIGISKDQPPDRLRELRQAAGNLLNSPRRKRGKVEAVLPSMKMGTPAEAEEQEEEDE